MKLTRLITLFVLLGHVFFVHGAEFWQAGQGLDEDDIRITSFAGDGNTLYAGSYFGNGHFGDVYRSVDKGATWKRIPSTGLTNVSVLSLALAPDGTFYAGTQNGIFKSVDKGATWTLSLARGFTPYIQTIQAPALAFAPDGTLYAGTYDGIFKSTDKGVTWTTANSGLASKYILALVIAPDGALYAGTYKSGVFRSYDKGATWTAASAGLSHMTIRALAPAPDGALYVVTYLGGIFRSYDHGATWTTANSGLTNTNVRALALLPDGVLYATTGDGSAFRSIDKGTTWVATGASDGLVNTLTYTQDGTLYAGTFNRGVFKSVDGGATWKAASKGLIYPGVPALVLAQDGTLYAGTDVAGVFRSVDKGVTWMAVSRQTNPNINETISTLCIAPDGTLYAGIQSNFGSYAGMSIDEIRKSTDQGATWTTVRGGLPQQASILALTLSPNGTLYAGTSSGVFKSGDKGATWVAASSGLTDKAIDVLAFAPDGALYAGTSGGSVFRSEDQGGTWIRPNGGLTDEAVDALALAPDGVLYAGTWGRGVFRSADKGATWAAASSGLTSLYVIALALAPDGVLYAGTYHGVFRSADKGETWTEANSGLISVAQKLVFAPDGALYAGTWGRGVQRMARSADKLAGLALLSPSTLPENTSVTFQAEAFYDNGYRQSVKPAWSADNPAAASIDADGKLTALEVSQDTPVTITATYSEGGVTQSAYRQVVVRNTPAPLTSLKIRSTKSWVKSGGSISLTAIAGYGDGATSPVVPAWRVISGPASISANGVLTAQAVSADSSIRTPVKISAIYSEGSLAQEATHEITIFFALFHEYKLAGLRIVGSADLVGGQEARYSAIVTYEDGTEAEVTPNWLSRDPASPIDASGKLRVANEGKAVTLVAHYAENISATVDYVVNTTPSSDAAGPLKVKIAQETAQNPGGVLDVDWSFENFPLAARYDLHAWVVTPDRVRIYLKNSGEQFDMPSFETRKTSYRANELLLRERRPMLHFTIPFKLLSGTYTFHAVATRPGADPDDSSQWVGHDSATVTLR